MNNTVHYTTQNRNKPLLRIIVDNIDTEKAPIQLDLSLGDQVSFPMEVPYGYSVKIGKLVSTKSLGKNGKSKTVYCKRYALIPH